VETASERTFFFIDRILDPVLSLKLDLIQTLAIAAVVFYCGVLLKTKIPILERLNIPSAVVGGLIFAGLMLLARDRYLNVEFDAATQPLFMVVFFTTIGMGASLPLLKRGGAQVLIFLIISTLFCFLQNFLGMGIAKLFGVNALLGVLAGSVTLVGGPATALAFAPLFKDAGIVGADTLGLTAATFGIVCGGIVGGPVGTWLIKRHHQERSGLSSGKSASEICPDEITIQVDREDSSLMVSIIVAAIAMGLGSIVSKYFQSLGWTLPAYIGAMLVASVLRNLDDARGWFKIDHSAMTLIGTISLNIFLVVALMNLRLWELLHLAIPLFAILVAQVFVVALFAATLSYRFMGKDYESAVMASGFIGFALGTTANAVANMKTLVGKFGAAPRAFLVVPMVGAFFIDFTNALIITFFLNWLG
jgi:ESS family glutamate:Na+ symporter